MPIVGNENNVFACDYQTGMGAYDEVKDTAEKIWIDDDEMNALPYGPEKYLLPIKFRTLGASRAACKAIEFMKRAWNVCQ